jgi:hypothetical protein
LGHFILNRFFSARTVVGFTWGVDEINALTQPIQGRVLKEMELETVFGGASILTLNFGLFYKIVRVSALVVFLSSGLCSLVLKLVATCIQELQTFMSSY